MQQPPPIPHDEPVIQNLPDLIQPKHSPQNLKKAPTQKQAQQSFTSKKSKKNRAGPKVKIFDD